ncbi:hypothetical protein [Streptomyces sp. NPDC001070]
MQAVGWTGLSTRTHTEWSFTPGGTDELKAMRVQVRDAAGAFVGRTVIHA